MYYSGNELINPFKVLERVGIQPGWHVADLGCGSLGHFVFPAAQFVGGDGRIFAVDVQQVVLRSIENIAKAEQYWNIQTVWSDIEVPHATHITPHSLDLTIVANNLYLSSHREALIDEALRLTKPNGKLLIIEWKPGVTILGPPDQHRLSPDETQSYCTHVDLHLIDAFDAGDCHYALVYQYALTIPPTISSALSSEDVSLLI